MPKRYKKFGRWALLPRPKMKEMPEFIPEVLSESYYQACVIADVSPRAAGALARYCLRRMIRDFWKIPENQFGTLAAELDYVESRIPPESKRSIGLVRSFGNIRSYMQEHTDTMVDADPKEVELLIRLNEILFEDWYAARHERENRANDLDAFIKSIKSMEPERTLQLEPVTALPPHTRAQTTAP